MMVNKFKRIGFKMLFNYLHCNAYTISDLINIKNKYLKNKHVGGPTGKTGQQDIHVVLFDVVIVTANPSCKDKTDFLS